MPKALTDLPGHHWFGYYDKLQFNPAGTHVLCMEVDFEGRSPQPDDIIRLGIIELDTLKWTKLGQTASWGWQQGCMLQFLPGSDDSVVWNERVADRFVSVIFNVNTRERREIPFPIYALSPDGKSAVSTDFRRINDMRPGYGYAGLPDPNREILAPKNAGIWHINLETGASKLIFSIQDAVDIPFAHHDNTKAKHWFNHLLISPDGQRTIFLHRWRLSTGGTFHTRMLTVALDGSTPRVVDDSGNMSHFVWKDPAHILGFSKPVGHDWAFYLFDERDGSMTMELDERRNGHCLYLPGNKIILNDTYPIGPERLQELYLYDLETGQKAILGAFNAPKAYSGEWRCDLHPRFSPDGRNIVFDSAHEGKGRQLYMLNIGKQLDCMTDCTSKAST